MKLKLKHYSPYLPYKLVFYAGKIANTLLTYPMLGIPVMGKITSYTNGEDFADGLHVMDLKQMNLKPILHPLSDLTEEIDVNGDKFVPTERIKRYMLVDFKYIDRDAVRSIHFPKGNICIISINYEIVEECPLGFYNKLIEWHFDIFGLIPAGLAIDINTLN